MCPNCASLILLLNSRTLNLQLEMLFPVSSASSTPAINLKHKYQFYNYLKKKTAQKLRLSFSYYPSYFKISNLNDKMKQLKSELFIYVSALPIENLLFLGHFYLALCIQQEKTTRLNDVPKKYKIKY